MTNVNPDPDEIPEADEADENDAPMWKPKDPAEMVADAVAPAGADPAPAAPTDGPHPHQQVWVQHESGQGEPQLISEHSLSAMAAQGWGPVPGRPRLQEGPNGLEAVAPVQESVSAPDGGEGEEG
jgi:hypothetical protein